MYIFIINPIAGNGRAKTIHLQLIQDPNYSSLQPVHYYTTYRGHAEVIAQQIQAKQGSKRVKGIVVIGGDGTLHEVVNGLKMNHLPLSFIPGGSGNDFARGNTLIKNPKKTLKAIKNNTKTLDYWLGLYQTSDAPHRHFVNCLGFGFDAVVATSANRSPYKKVFNKFNLGRVIYLFTLIKELIFFTPTSITVELDGVKKEFSHCLLFSVNNHPFIGGGMKINPQAKNQAEKYSIIVIDSISKWKVLALFSTVFIGQHVNFKEVSTFQAREIKITSQRSIPFQVDGETGSTTMCTITKPNIPLKVCGLL